MYGQTKLVFGQSPKSFKTELQADFRALFTGGKRLCDTQQVFVLLRVLSEQHNKALW